MTVDRLTFLDESFLALDAPDAPLHVAFVLRADGSPPSVSGLRRHLDSRMHRVPRFRRRLARTALTGGGLRWVDDQAFDIAHHVSAISVAAPGGDDALRALAERLLADPLPRDRPMWRTYLVTGLGDGWAFIGQVHHALVDGAAALEVAALLFDAEPRPAADETPGWAPAKPAPTSSAAAIARDRTQHVLHGTQTMLRAGASVAARAASALPGGRPADSGAGGGLSQVAQAAGDIMRDAGDLSLARNATARRAIGWAQLDLAAIKVLAREADATVNDVVLTLVGRALSNALERRDESPIPIKAMVPVNVRAGSSQQAANAISSVVVDLPADRANLREALSIVSTRTRELKGAGRAAPLVTVAELADLLPAPAGRAMTRLLASLASYHVIVSNVPGPPVPLYLMGRRVRALYPSVPLLRGQGLTVGALSYCGVVHVGVYADAEVVPDAQQIADDTRAALAALFPVPREAPPARLHDAARSTTPWRQRARQRRTHA